MHLSYVYLHKVNSVIRNTYTTTSVEYPYQLQAQLLIFNVYELYLLQLYICIFET